MAPPLRVCLGSQRRGVRSGRFNVEIFKRGKSVLCANALAGWQRFFFLAVRGIRETRNLLKLLPEARSKLKVQAVFPDGVLSGAEFHGKRR